MFKKRKEKEHAHKRILKRYLSKAGIETSGERLSQKLFITCIIVNLLLSVYLIFHFSGRIGYSVAYMITIMIVIWIFVFILLLITTWLIFFLAIDLNIFKRKASIEDILPDFLQLVSANVRAGMPIDRALWYAIRPRFGVLSKEIEMVAKQTMSGVPLEQALRSFSNKYNSDILQRSVNLLIEGLEAGGEVGNLLNKISTDIQESRIIRKEMAAEVTAYTLFISAATIFAAPMLFALSYQLLLVIKGLVSSLDLSSAGSIGLFTFSKISVQPSHFMIFCITSLLITSFFSAIIIATIKKGNIKAGLKYIPMFMIATLVFFFIAKLVLGIVFQGLIF